MPNRTCHTLHMLYWGIFHSADKQSIGFYFQFARFHRAFPVWILRCSLRPWQKRKRQHNHVHHNNRLPAYSQISGDKPRCPLMPQTGRKAQNINMSNAEVFFIDHLSFHNVIITYDQASDKPSLGKCKGLFSLVSNFSVNCEVKIWAMTAFFVFVPKRPSTDPALYPR